MTHPSFENHPDRNRHDKLSDRDQFYAVINRIFERAKQEGVSPLTGEPMHPGSLLPQPGQERMVVRPAVRAAFVPREYIVERPTGDSPDETHSPRVIFFAKEQVTIAADDRGRVLQTAALDPMDAWVPFPGSEFPIGQTQLTGPRLDHTLQLLESGTLYPDSLWM